MRWGLRGFKSLYASQSRATSADSQCVVHVWSIYIQVAKWVCRTFCAGSPLECRDVQDACLHSDPDTEASVGDEGQQLVWFDGGILAEDTVGV